MHEKLYAYTVPCIRSPERPMHYPLRQNYRPSKYQAPAWLKRLWRWL
ncbi:hypothetical protein [Piscinibacter defluvii]|nr:hypothetical protein [Piscinibacter defluvii]